MGKRGRSRKEVVKRRSVPVSVFQLFSIGIGPSSSHTVGPMRAALLFAQDLENKGNSIYLERMTIELFGSLAMTGKGHATDIAILLGLEGYAPESIDPDAVAGYIERIQMEKNLRFLGKKQIPFDVEKELIFHKGKRFTYHSNAIRFRAFDAKGELLLSDIYYSVGGGFVVPQDMALEPADSPSSMESMDPVLSDPSELFDWVSLFALAVNEENAAGGRVVTAPTNGAAGVIPAVLHYYMKFTQDPTEEGIITFFLTASAIGILYKEGASLSAAEMGCQGEVGVATSMAAAGLTAAMGGSNAEIENAAEIAMEHSLGLTCDPVGGLVQIPCIERNTMGTIKAINAFRLARHARGEHRVRLDEVICAMRETGEDMQTKYKETSEGGLALFVPVGLPEC
ncbi:MAG: L-serine ammonia-lyase [Chlamydiales bacterium]|nr:L-serine ammonia-lyase [Chlamydiales bacterium]